MAVLRFNIMAILFLSSCLAIGEPLGIEIQNNLQKCFTLNNKDFTYFNEIPLLKLAVKPISETSSCGCKSAISQYSVYAVSEWHEVWVMSSDFTFLGREYVQIPIGDFQGSCRVIC